MRVVLDIMHDRSGVTRVRQGRYGWLDSAVVSCRRAWHLVGLVQYPADGRVQWPPLCYVSLSLSLPPSFPLPTFVLSLSRFSASIISPSRYLSRIIFQVYLPSLFRLLAV